MKRCPECRRDYYDDTLLYCLDDGNALLEGPASGKQETRDGSPENEPATAILSVPPAIAGGLTGVTDETDVKTAILQPPATAGGSDPVRGFDKRLLLAPLLLAVVLGGFFGYRYLSGSGAKQIESIAVMPFVDESGNADVEYLSDGMTETLIGSLSQLSNLNVKGRSSVFRYKGKNLDTKTLGKELGVQAILYGRVIQRGDQLTLSLELVDAVTENVIWSGKYDRKQADVVSLQSEIARDVSSKLKTKLAGNAIVNAEKRYTSDPEAYQLYLKGRFHWNKRGEENLRKAIEQFKAASEKDPGFALAFVGLADSYVVLPYFSNVLPDEVLPQAKANAMTALQIDDSVGQAHTALGYVERLSRNWTTAEKELKRGIELEPNSATAHHWYANYLVDLGRLDEALFELKRAQELDPVSTIISNNLAETYMAKGDLNAAYEQCQRSIDIDPTVTRLRLQLALVYLKQGRNAEALAEAEKSVELAKQNSTTLGLLGYVYARTGKADQAIAVIADLKQRYSEQKANAYDLARTYIGLGNKDEAFAWLEEDFESRNATMPGFLNLPPLNELRVDPRFKTFQRRLGLPE